MKDEKQKIKPFNRGGGWNFDAMLREDRSHVSLRCYVKARHGHCPRLKGVVSYCALLLDLRTASIWLRLTQHPE